MTDVIAGWGLTVEQHDDAEWSSKAMVFAQAMSEGEDGLRLKDTFALMQIFLDGVG